MKDRNINALIVPTGIGASIGGYAGDANPIAKRFAAISNILITHPNVVNAAMLTDIAPNVIVLEGALLDLFFEEKIFIQARQEERKKATLGKNLTILGNPYRAQHRIAIVMDCAAPPAQIEITQNCMAAATHVYGSDIIPEIFFTDSPVAANLDKITNPQTLLRAASRAIDAGATALALLCVLPDGLSEDIFSNYLAGSGVDPIGLIEAKISHLVSREFLISSAHAPVFVKVAQHQGLVHPRVAAEHLGFSFLPSVIKCLEAMPQIAISDSKLRVEALQEDLVCSVPNISARDLRFLVVPHSSCNAVPMHACEHLGVELITIQENQTVLDDTASKLGLKHSSYASYDSFFSTCNLSYPAVRV